MTGFAWNETTTTAQYKDIRFFHIKKAENIDLGVYYDSANPSHPSIGVAFNLDEQTYLDSVILKIFYPEGAITSLIGQDSVFADDIADIISAGKSTYPTNELLQDALNTVMSDRASYWENEILLNPTLPHPTTTRGEFKFVADEEAIDIFNIKIQDYEDAVDTWLSGIPESNERAVLVSLSYNGVLYESNSLKNAILADDRAEAWVQIRYLSNAGSLGNLTPAQIAAAGYNGQAARRYAESDLFGLYKPGTLDEAEARQIFRAISRHEEHIAKYDARFDHLLDDAGTKFDTTIESLSQITEPAKALLVDLYIDAHNIELLPHNIYIDHASTSGGLTEKNVYNGDFKNTLILGGEGNDILYGGGGVDVIYGEAGNDTLIFRQSDVTIYDTIKEYYDGGEDASGTDRDVLRLEFRNGELDAIAGLRAELAELYGNMVLNAPSGNFTYTFQNLNLQIAGFEDMEVWVDGKKVSLDLKATDDYYIKADLDSQSGYLFYSSYHPGTDYSFANWYEDVSTTAGTYTTSAGGTIEVTSQGYFTYTAASLSYVQDSFTYSVTDSTGAISTATSYFINQTKVYGLTNSYSAFTAVDYKSVFNTSFGTETPVTADYLFDSGTGKYYWDYNPDDTITGSAYADKIDSGAGNDTIYGVQEMIFFPAAAAIISVQIVF